MSSVRKHRERSSKTHFNKIPVMMFARNAQKAWEARYFRMKANIDLDDQEMVITAPEN